MLQSMGSQVVGHDLATEQQPGMRKHVEYKYMYLGIIQMKTNYLNWRKSPYHVVTLPVYTKRKY